jgi:hypothetical protein
MHFNPDAVACGHGNSKTMPACDVSDEEWAFVAP